MIMILNKQYYLLVGTRRNHTFSNQGNDTTVHSVCLVSEVDRYSCFFVRTAQEEILLQVVIVPFCFVACVLLACCWLCIAYCLLLAWCSFVLKGFVPWRNRLVGFFSTLVYLASYWWVISSILCISRSEPLAKFHRAEFICGGVNLSRKFAHQLRPALPSLLRSVPSCRSSFTWALAFFGDMASFKIVTCKLLHYFGGTARVSSRICKRLHGEGREGLTCSEEAIAG